MHNLARIFGLVVTLGSIMTPARAQVPEIADPTLPDIAMVKPHPAYGAVIIYNPNICASIGLACGFFRAHEYGHVALGHAYMLPGAYAANKEASADCWAAHNAQPNEILAAYHLFMNGGSSPNWSVYGNPSQRAQRVRSCAISAGRWIGP